MVISQFVTLGAQRLPPDRPEPWLAQRIGADLFLRLTAIPADVSQGRLADAAAILRGETGTVVSSALSKAMTVRQ